MRILSLRQWGERLRERSENVDSEGLRQVHDHEVDAEILVDRGLFDRGSDAFRGIDAYIHRDIVPFR